MPREMAALSGETSFIAIKGKAADSVGNIVAHLDDFKVGDKIRPTVTRLGKSREVKATRQAGG